MYYKQCKNGKVNEDETDSAYYDSIRVYKQKEVIDFEDLGEHRIFAISGNTGAGKTTIFDAICYVLYGEASGEERSDTSMLRSQFADDNVYTSVELTFQLKETL